MQVFIEEQFENGFVSPSEKPIFIKKIFNNEHDPGNNIEESYILKRIPIRVGKSGVFRHLVARKISNIKNNNNKIRRYILSFGKFEVTEIIDYNVKNDTIFYMATMENRPGYRHFYQLKLSFNITNGNIFLMAGDPICLTCQNSIEKREINYYNPPNLDFGSELHGKLDMHINHSTILDSTETDIKPTCLFNKVHISPLFKYYIQECLGPNTPASFIIDLQTNAKVLTWNNGFELLQMLSKFATPSIKKFSVLVKNGFEAQVKLYLPPNLDEDQDLAYPLILNT